MRVDEKDTLRSAISTIERAIEIRDDAETTEKTDAEFFGGKLDHANTIINVLELTNAGLERTVEELKEDCATQAITIKNKNTWAGALKIIIDNANTKINTLELANADLIDTNAQLTTNIKRMMREVETLKIMYNTRPGTKGEQQ